MRHVGQACRGNSNLGQFENSHLDFKYLIPAAGCESVPALLYLEIRPEQPATILFPVNGTVLMQVVGDFESLRPVADKDSLFIHIPWQSQTCQIIYKRPQICILGNRNQYRRLFNFGGGILITT